MAYALRYYKDIPQQNGGAFRLEIYKKDSTTAAIEIGAVIQSLSLQIQGQQSDIDTPIVKTSLSMTFADASDLENGKKNGFWQEFYTPDAVLWKVILKAKDAQETAFRTIWGGYVTPDSFSETLSYRGSVNIIARDNIGHLQDFPFDADGDADGMISLYDLLQTAWAKIESPMDLLMNPQQVMNAEGVVAYDTLMNVSAFKELNWYEAVEKALYSYGIVMRYVGDNAVHIGALRFLPNLGYVDAASVPHLEPVFLAGAQRELVPAAKRIEESVSYELETAVSMPQVKVQDFTGNTYTYRCKIDGVEIDGQSFGTIEHDAPVWSINHSNGWDDSGANTLFFNPHAYELGYFVQQRGLGEEVLRYMYIAANNVDSRQVTFSRNITCSDMVIRMKFGEPCSLDSANRFEQQGVFNLKKIVYSVTIEQNGITQYYGKDGSWKADVRELTAEFDATQKNFDFEQFLSMSDLEGNAELSFIIKKIEYAQTSYTGNKSKAGLYACVQDLSFCIPESLSLLENNSVNTNYQEGNNVILTRDPELAPAYNVVALPAFIKNGIFYRQGDAILPAKTWGWAGGSQLQMAVFNHLQLLSYYAKPNNLISGSIVNADTTRMSVIYEWKGAEHILVSGNVNLLTGYIDGAMLREFARYEDMWSEVEGAGLPPTEQESRSNVEGGAGASSNPTTYTNTTNVNIGTGGGGGVGASNLNDLLDVNTAGVTARSVLYFNGTEWVDRNIDSLLTDYVKTESLASLWRVEDGKLVTDYDIDVRGNISADKEVSAGGAGQEGGSAEVELDVLRNWNEYDNYYQILGANLGVDLNDRVKAIEGGSVTPDISKLAEKTWVNQQINAATKDKVSTSTLRGVQQEIQAEIQDIEQKIQQGENKDNEQDSNIEKLAKRVTTNEGSITNIRSKDAAQDKTIAGLQSTIADLLNWHEKVGSHLNVDSDTMTTDLNFSSMKEISAGGAGQEGGTETGYKVYHFRQTSPSREWKIKHDLEKFPNVKIIDTLKQLCFGDVYYDDINNVTIKFGAAESGDAYLD